LTASQTAVLQKQLQNYLYCVGLGVRLYSLSQSADSDLWLAKTAKTFHCSFGWKLASKLFCFDFISTVRTV